MEDEERIPNATNGTKMESRSLDRSDMKVKKERSSASGTPHSSKSPSMSPPDRVKAEGDDDTKRDPEPAPKLSRRTSSKTIGRSAPLVDHFPDVTEEACTHFQLINDCLYGSKHMGSSEHDALDCDCSEEWHDGQNHACGEDSDCINRATKMECVDGDCNCGAGCQNQRFQRKQYANVSVIKTEKKGFGLRADHDLQANDFVFEYIGEVINEPTFRRRMVQYDEEGIKHFYFMSLTKSEFVDATKKGNLGRFCNHSCNPNCYVDKWVVGDKLRMGIFASRKIKTGEELVFNYNVDRYGADPQPCYCGEPNCTGFIGGKTQTERATKLPLATIEALGIDDGDGWDTTVAKKPRKKKPNEDDEEYVNSVQPRGLDEEGVTKVMAALMQCKEKWIAVKLLTRIQAAEDDRVRNRVVRMHGYQILKTTLNTFIDDDNVVLQILDVLYKFPRLTKNKISDSKIEATIQGLTESEHEDVAGESKRLLDEWSKLETAYRIPRKKFDPTAPAANSFEERRNLDRVEEVVAAKPLSPFSSVVIPKGPRSSVPQRNVNFFNGQRPRRPHHNNYPLPSGWFTATDARGNIYYYNKAGATTWKRPTAPAPEAPKAPSKAKQDQKALQDIIDSLTKDPTPKPSASQTPQPVGTPVQEPKKEKWRSLPVEKQMKIYENTLFPHVRYVMDKFRHKLPKEQLKKFAKEVNKKLVASDYKNKRVDDPTSISSKQEKKVKKYVKDFLERAVEKYRDHEKKKAERTARHAANGVKNPAAADEDQAGNETLAKDEADVADDDLIMSDVDDVQSPGSSPERKRKREEDENSPSLTPSETPSVKRLKEDEAEPSPPPPPPPPPEAAMDVVMAEEEEALARENEEAQRLADEAEQDRARQEEALQRENEEAMREFEKEQQTKLERAGEDAASHSTVNGEDLSKTDLPNGTIMEAEGMDMESTAKDNGTVKNHEARKQEVLSH